MQVCASLQILPKVRLPVQVAQIGCTELVIVHVHQTINLYTVNQAGLARGQLQYVLLSNKMMNIFCPLSQALLKFLTAFLILLAKMRCPSLEFLSLTPLQQRMPVSSFRTQEMPCLQGYTLQIFAVNESEIV